MVRTLWISALLVGLVLPVASTAQAQMVVSPDAGERVDHPYAPSFYARRPYRRHGRHQRFLVTGVGFPTPQPFGWFGCCL